MQVTINPKIIELINYYETEIYQLPLDMALEQAEQLGLLLRSNEVGIYSLNELETFLIDNVFSKLSISDNVIDNGRDNKIVFIATELYHTGGHTRLMERLATFLDSKPDLLITKKPMESIIERENAFFSTIHYGPNNYPSVVENIFFFFSVILKYNIVILNTHPEDIYAIVACGLAKKIKKDIKVHFVNHADHVFSYGSSISDVWYEISDYGVTVDAKRELKAKKCFLGIPIDTSKQNSEGSYKFENGDLILSAASAGKYKPNNQQSIMPLVSAMLDKYDKSNFQIIGVNIFTNYWWWGIKLKCRNRLTLSKSLPYDEYIKATCAAKLYIDSHPFPGGTAFAEQFLQGRLSVGLKSIYNGYTPLEAFKKDCTIDVFELIDTINENDICNMRVSLEDVHGFENVKRRFLNAVFNNEYTEREVAATGVRIVNEINFIPRSLKFNKKTFECANKKAILVFLLKKLKNIIKK